jgi:hypothetical protein
MVRRRGIDYEEALRRLEFQDAAHGVTDEVHGLLDDRDGGVWWGHDGRLKIGVVRRDGEIAGPHLTRVTDLLAAHGFLDRTDFVAVDHSQQQLFDAHPAITDELIDLYRAGKIASGARPDHNALYVHLATTVTGAERARIEHVAERAPVRVLLNQTDCDTLFAVEE